MTRIIGIDPGSRVTGYGIIDQQGQRIHYVASGCIRVEGKAIAERDFRRRFPLIALGLTKMNPRDPKARYAALRAMADPGGGASDGERRNAEVAMERMRAKYTEAQLGIAQPPSISATPRRPCREGPRGPRRDWTWDDVDRAARESGRREREGQRRRAEERQRREGEEAEQRRQARAAEQRRQREAEAQRQEQARQRARAGMPKWER